MKMLHIVCGKRLEDEILAIFKELGIKGYTVISGVGGSGVTGTLSGATPSANHNANTNTLESISKLTIDVSNECTRRTLRDRHTHFQPNSIFCHA